MIALLSCSWSWSKINALPLTGESLEDSVLISIDDIRKANAKIIELEYEKQINVNLTNIISNDSVAIHLLNMRIDDIQSENKRTIKRIKRERNTLGGLSIGLTILLIIAIL